MPGMKGENMTTDVQHYIPLTSAYLCQDCDAIGNNSVHCSACSSDVVMSLEGVLNRKQARKSRNQTQVKFPQWRSQIQIAA